MRAGTWGESGRFGGGAACALEVLVGAGDRESLGVIGGGIAGSRRRCRATA